MALAKKSDFIYNLQSSINICLKWKITLKLRGEFPLHDCVMKESSFPTDHQNQIILN